MRLNLAFKKIDLLTLSSRRPVSWFGQGEAVSPPPTPHLSLQVRLGCLQPDLPFLQLRPLWDSEHTPDPRVASPGPCPTLDSLFPVLLIFPGLRHHEMVSTQGRSQLTSLLLDTPLSPPKSHRSASPDDL